MFLERADKEKVISKRAGKIQALLEEFMESDMDCARVIVGEDEYKSPTSTYASIKRTLGSARMTNVSVFAKKGVVYIVKLDGSEKL